MDFFCSSLHSRGQVSQHLRIIVFSFFIIIFFFSFSIQRSSVHGLFCFFGIFFSPVVDGGDNMRLLVILCCKFCIGQTAQINITVLCRPVLASFHSPVKTIQPLSFIVIF